MVEAFTESKRESNFEMHSAVPIAEDGRLPTHMHAYGCSYSGP